MDEHWMTRSGAQTSQYSRVGGVEGATWSALRESTFRASGWDPSAKARWTNPRHLAGAYSHEVRSKGPLPAAYPGTLRRFRSTSGPIGIPEGGPEGAPSGPPSGIPMGPEVERKRRNVPG